MRRNSVAGCGFQSNLHATLRSAALNGSKNLHDAVSGVRSRIMFNLFTVNKAISTCTGCVAHSAALIIDATFHVAKWRLSEDGIDQCCCIVILLCEKETKAFPILIPQVMACDCDECVRFAVRTQVGWKMNEKMKTN